MEKIRLVTLEDVLAHNGRVLAQEATWENVVFVKGCVTVPVTVSGPSWEKRIDARGARFVQDIQRQADSLFTELAGERAGLAPLIKFEAKEGSSSLLPDFTPVLMKAVEIMPPESIPVILGLLICSGTGLLAYRAFLKFKGSESDKKLIEKSLDMAQQLATSSQETLRTFSAPIRNYTQGVGDQDRVSIAGSEPVLGEEAKALVRVPRSPRSITRHVSCDGVFHLLGLNLEYPVPALELEQDDYEVNALLERLDPETKKSLLAKVGERMDQRRVPFPITLQLDVYFTAKQVKYGTVIGVGSVRRGMHHYRLSDLPLPASVPVKE